MGQFKDFRKITNFPEKKRKSFWEVSEKGNEQIPRKVCYGRTDERTNERTDRTECIGPLSAKRRGSNKRILQWAPGPSHGGWKLFYYLMNAGRGKFVIGPPALRRKGSYKFSPVRPSVRSSVRSFVRSSVTHFSQNLFITFF